MDITKLISLIKVKESDTDVFVYIGYIRICSIHEEDGRWYPSIKNKEIPTLDGFSSKDDAFASIVRHLTD